MERILIGTKNPHKRHMLAEMVSGHFEPTYDDALPDVEEHGQTFEEIARNKATDYSRLTGGYVISTDGGASFPALKGKWDPLHTKRFGTNDQDRIQTLLRLLESADDRTVEWHEAVAIAWNGEVLFSATARAMDGVIQTVFDPAKYREGIWLCSLTAFPQFGGRNYFDLTDEERAQTEDSWSELQAAVRRFLSGNERNPLA